MRGRRRWRTIILVIGTTLSMLMAVAFLWLPCLAVAIPTLLVWWFGPKPTKPGHCRCGYNLTGIVSGRCPECGQAVSR